MTTAVKQAPEYVKRSQLVKLLGLSTETVRVFIRDGVLPPPIRLTSHTQLWSMAEVRDVLERARRGATASAPAGGGRGQSGLAGPSRRKRAGKVSTGPIAARAPTPE
jgi:predicted DNA-binding transcriptional regulator AlpA